MKSKISGMIIFLMGALFGTVFTRTYFKSVYEKQADEEIASVKEHFSKKAKEKDEPQNTSSSEVKRIIKDSLYSVPQGDESHEEEKKKEPYVISPSEFGGIDGYSLIGLTYYADGILTDDADEVVKYGTDNVGLDWIDHIGEYEGDAVYVRNDKNECDYEIVFDRSDYKALNGDEGD